MRVEPATLTEDRLNLLRRADAVVRKLTKESGFDALIWQNPVILIPVGALNDHNSVVLRPDRFRGRNDGERGPHARRICSDAVVSELRAIEGIAGVFYDLTNKPPGTIEWE